MDFLSFETRVQLAIDAARGKDIGAQLREVVMLSDYSVTRCMFSGSHPQHSFAVSVDMDGSVRGPNAVMSWPFANSNEGVPWPVGMDYNKARGLFDDAYPRTAWSHVVLRHPDTLPTVNPEFVFAVGGGYVVVDTVTEQVYRVNH